VRTLLFVWTSPLTQGGMIGRKFACGRFIFNSSSSDEGRLGRNMEVNKERDQEENVLRNVE
jgi:hypothetical protein